MKQLMSLPLYSENFAEYESWEDLRAELDRLGCDGLEGVWGGEEFPADLPAELIVGYHLTFYPDWLDFYRDDRKALVAKFGSVDTASRFYGGLGPEVLLEQYRQDLNRAVELLMTTEDKTYIIAEKVGYPEQNYFSYVFKKKFGVSPTKFRGAR